MFYAVYKITNKINGKFYIGKHQTKNLDDGYMGSGKLIKAAIQKYGLENFEKQVLHVFKTEAEMNEAEKSLVILGEDSYNLAEGGQGGASVAAFGSRNKGKKHSQEAIEKLRRKSSGKKHSLETKQKISESNKKTQSARSKMISQSLKGRKLSEEHKLRLSIAAKRENLSDETRLKKSLAAKTRPSRKHTDETKEKLRIAACLRHLKNKGHAPDGKAVGLHPTIDAVRFRDDPP